MYLITLLCVDNLVKRARGQRGDHLNDVVLFRAACEDYLTLRVAQLAESSRSDVEGHVDLGAKHCCREVDLLHVDEDSGTEPDFVEGRVIFS